MNKKNLLYIISNLNRGGSQTFLYNLIRLIPKDRFNITVLSYGKAKDMADDFAKLGCQIKYFSNIGLFRKRNEFIHLIKEIKPQIVHTNIATGGVITHMLLRLAGVKRSFATVHRFAPENSFYRNFNEMFVRFFVTKIVNITYFSDKKYRREFAPLCKKTAIIPNGIDLSTISDKKIKLGKGFHIISVANLIEKKGYETGIKVINELLKKYPQIKYHIVGDSIQGNRVKDFLNNYIKENGMEDSVIFHGYQEDIPTYLNSTDIFFSPSEQEIMPMSILEAFACKLPVVATNVGGVSEMLDNNKYGILTDVGNISEMAAAIESLIIDKALNNRLKESSYERALYYQVSNTVEQYLQIYSM